MSTHQRKGSSYELTLCCLCMHAIFSFHMKCVEKNVNFMDLNSMFASGCMFAIYLIKVALFCSRSFTLLLALEVRKKGKAFAD